jgi:hypothetical protein
MPPSRDAQAPRPLLACLGEGSTHRAAGQEPLPSGPPGPRPAPSARNPPLHCRALAGILSDEQGDPDDSYPVHSAPRRDLVHAACRGTAVLRAIPDEQVLMWDSSGSPAGRPWTGPARWPGPRAWTATADRPRPTKPRRIPGRAQAMTGTTQPRPAAAATGQLGQRLERK